MGIEEKQEQLRRQIALLEWDLPLIREGELKGIKSTELSKLKQELERIRKMTIKGGW